METVKEGGFHIYAIKSVDEGMEILTGVPVEELKADGTYPAGTVNRLVDDRLGHLARSVKGFATDLPGEPAS